MHVLREQPITVARSTAGVPAGDRMGCRVEVPITRAIVSAWREAELSEDGGLWTVTLEAPVHAGEYVLVWRPGTSDPWPLGCEIVGEPVVVHRSRRDLERYAA